MAVDKPGERDALQISGKQECLTVWGSESRHRWDRVGSEGLGVEPESGAARPPTSPSVLWLFQAGLFRDRPPDHGELRALALLLLLLLPTAAAHLPLHCLRPGHLRHHRGAVGPVCHAQAPADTSRWVTRQGVSLRGSALGPHLDPDLCLEL